MNLRNLRYKSARALEKQGLTLPDRLFWDTDLSTLDCKKHARFIIHRVITRGRYDDWLTVRAYYGIDFVRQEILQMRHLDPKTLHFFSFYFGIEKEKFRCYTAKQSTPKPFGY